MASNTLGIDIVIGLLVILLISIWGYIGYLFIYESTKSTSNDIGSTGPTGPSETSPSESPGSNTGPGSNLEPGSNLPARTEPIPPTPTPGADSGSSGVVSITPTSETPTVTANQIKNGDIITLKDGNRTLGLKVWDRGHENESWMINIQDTGPETPWDWCTRENSHCQNWMIVKYDRLTNDFVKDKSPINSGDQIRLVHLQKSVTNNQAYFLTAIGSPPYLVNKSYCPGKSGCGAFVIQNVNLNTKPVVVLSKVYLNSNQADSLSRGYRLLNRSDDEQQRPTINRTDSPGQEAQWFIERANQTGINSLVAQVWATL